jgi:hypothetical protein
MAASETTHADQSLLFKGDNNKRPSKIEINVRSISMFIKERYEAIWQLLPAFVNCYTNHSPRDFADRLSLLHCC